MNTNQHHTGRQTDLEALRGMAAIVVVVHHFLLAFAPEISGFLPEYRTPSSLVGSPWFGLINGKAAVYFFFVLSGYVLSIHFLKNGNIEQLRTGFIKRLPRLAFPVLLSSILAYFVMRLDFLYCLPASQYTGSSWLRNLGFGHDLASFSPNFLNVITESVFVFLNGVNRYNSSLWSMQPEMTGSFLVMSCAVFFRVLLGMRHLIYSGTLIFIVIARLDPMLCSFLLGLFIALAQANHPNFRLPRLVSWLLFLLGVYLCGYVNPNGLYHIFQELAMPTEQAYTLGGMFILSAVVFCPSNFAALNGRLGKLLGQQSFPTYLLHTTVLGSVTSYLYLKLIPNMELQVLLPILLIFTLTLTITLALCMNRIDMWWVAILNRKFSPK
jgi:peptidoglycan/LPS O-acetylase OafA/YrhL